MSPINKYNLRYEHKSNIGPEMSRAATGLGLRPSPGGV